MSKWKKTCQTCDGDGRELDDVSAAALARAIGVEAVVNDACPDCSSPGDKRGRGWNPTAQAIYAAANVLAVNDMQKGPPDMLAEIGSDLAAPYLALAKDQLIELLSMGDTK